MANGYMHKEPKQPIALRPGQRLIPRPWREANGVRLWARAWPIIVDE